SFDRDTLLIAQDDAGPGGSRVHPHPCPHVDPKQTSAGSLIRPFAQEGSGANRRSSHPALGVLRCSTSLRENRTWHTCRHGLLDEQDRYENAGTASRTCIKIGGIPLSPPSGAGARPRRSIPTSTGRP